MPHIIIEYAHELAGDGAVAAMLSAVHEAVAASGLFEVGHIRVRAWPVEHYLVGGQRKGFIHAQCRIHDGRTEAQRRLLSETVLATLCAQGWAAEIITVEVVEMDHGSYAKSSERTDDVLAQHDPAG